jgi:hypothetical protein
VLRGGAKVADEGDDTQPADYDELAEDTVYPEPGAAVPGTTPAPAPAA